ncbi:MULTISPECIES: substrate-binding domain-containing protein [unclassified Aliivibrio]|uniref:substrate-binding domain-containing protein n=1 Tax=unclassified Aliivibrio TaxID=2645654 RepID=UPI00080DF640|nr:MULTISPECIES: substrate-binding domain-containing protein [unclassified Aliivibrio]OCH13684.1 DNA-binding transcriptional regulator GalS [Aliivibrio sp. 1S165]OCH23734.1 DNA-binding transcriptional regulator GalS [Aliivibrio sp. 1S128]OCH31673.1 DNA-binding transcriptional regulator GalS [Aliivibrio sp. 1S175]
MATIKDVAKEAGVSVATVSRVVNKSPKASKAAIESVSSAMKKLGYRPNANARALVSKSTNTIGVMVGDVSDPFFGSMIKAIDNVAKTHQKHLLIGNGYHDEQTEREALELLINNRCESLVIHSKGLPNKELIQFAEEIPGLVLINRHIPEISGRCISLDNQQGAQIATEHLISQGHSHIAYINSEHDIDDSHHRKAGYLSALEKNNIQLNSTYIIEVEPTDEGGEIAINQLLERNLPITAIVCYNDYMAAGALSALEEHGISVPADISLMGFDNGLIAKYLYPKLSTIDYPIQTMAEHAIKLSLALVKGNGDGDGVQGQKFEPQLIERSSTAKK